MGNSGSTVSGSEQVFTSKTPTQFSQKFVDSLQNSTESDASRSKTLELHIQQRVADELKRIQDREDQTFADLEKKFADSDSDSKDTSSSPSSIIDSIKDTLTSNKSEPQSASRDNVLKEIEALKKTLEARKRPVQVDAEVETAKAELVACLRLKDRRPLDCWEEVDGFKKVVAKAEREWVGKVIS